MFALRALLPDKLVNPTREILQASRQPPPQKLAAQLKDAAITGSRDIQKFKKEYHSDEMRDLFHKVNTAEIPQGSDVWATDYVALAKRLEGGDRDKADSNVEPSVELISDSDAIKHFRDEHSNVEITMLDEEAGLPLQITVSSMVFRVEKSPLGYDVTLGNAEKESPLSKEVLKHVHRNHAKETLPGLLVCVFGLNSCPADYVQSLIASYAHLKSQKCEKCGKIFDRGLDFAIARKRENDTSNQKPPTWRSFHKSCMP